MTLYELEALIVEHFEHLVLIHRPANEFCLSVRFLTENFGEDAAIMGIKYDDWNFCPDARWSECAELEHDTTCFGFRFKDIHDAIIFKLACG